MHPRIADADLIAFALGELEGVAPARVESVVAADRSARRRLAIYREILGAARADVGDPTGPSDRVLRSLLAAQRAAPRGGGLRARAAAPSGGRGIARRLRPGAAAVAVLALVVAGVTRSPVEPRADAPRMPGSAPASAPPIASSRASRVPVIAFRTTNAIDAHLVAWDSIAVRAFADDSVRR
jgi:hypothetical protein